MADRHPDVYFRPSYGRAECLERSEYQLSVVRHDGAFQVPLVVRTFDDDTKDATSPYGYAGVYADPHLGERETAAAWDSLLDELRGHGIVTVFLRHSPLVPQAEMNFPHSRVVKDHPTVAVDVRDPVAAWGQMEGRCRTAIRKAMKAGATVEIRPATIADLSNGSEFRTLYEATMSRASAATFYSFPDRYYTQLLEALGSGLLIAHGRDAAGRILSSALFMYHQPFFHYHLSGSDPEANRLGLNNLVIWQAVMHAAELGAQTFHLGGGVVRDDSLHRFKASFSPHRLSYNATGVVVDEREYQRLLDVRSVNLADASFFPAYRTS